MKIVILDGYTENPGDLSWDAIAKLGDLTVYERTNINSEAEILERISDAEIVITNKTPISANVIEKAPNIKYIGVLATGYNVVDCDVARAKEIPVANIPTYGTKSVAQFTIAMLLEICHRVGHHSQRVSEGAWEKSSDFCFWDYPLIELDSKVMGIIGFGRIGQATAKIARALGMDILVFDTYCDESQLKEGYKNVALSELLKNSDVISLHCPLFPQTTGIINKETISEMKDGVIVLNTSRGPLIVEEDLCEALNSGKIYAAAVDVVSSEPIKADNPLLNAKNCIITPHIAWAAKESRQRLMDIATTNLKAFLENSPLNIVN